MSNKRINLTEDELRKQIIKHEGEYSYPTSDVDMGDVETILHCINGIGLIAELKRCYAFIDSHGLDEDIEHKIVIDLRECSIELLDELCFQAGVETGTKEEMIARLLE